MNSACGEGNWSAALAFGAGEGVWIEAAGVWCRSAEGGVSV